MKNLVKVHLVAVAILATATLTLAQTFTLYPNQVPKGAYVNGSDGDQQFIQTIRYVVGTTWTAVTGSPDITITLPDSMTIGDWDDDAVPTWSDEVTVIENTAGTVALGTVTASVIELEVTAAAPITGQYIEVTFPVETQSGASGSQNYTIAFHADVATETDGTVSVSYEDTLSLVSWEVDYAGNDDQSSTLGDVYPAAAASFFPAGGLDIVRDLAAAAVTGNNFWGLPADFDGVNDDGEATTVIWASQTPSLKRINNMNAHRPFDVTAVPIRPADWDGTETVGAVGNLTTPTYQLDAELLAEGIWFFYLTTSATGEWAVATSDSVDIRHWPTFASGTDVAGGYDYDVDGFYTPAAGDNSDVTLESGGTIGKDAALVSAGNNLSALDFFWSFQDLDNNADLDIFLSTDDLLGLTDLVITGSEGSEVVDSVGANSRKITSSPIKEEGSTSKFTYDIYTDKTTYEPADDYYVYYVANDGTNQAVYQLLKTAGAGFPKTVAVKHYPYFKFDDIYATDPVTFNTGTDDYFVISWGQTPASGLGDGDLDADGNATITFYYTSYIDAALDEGLEAILDMANAGAGRSVLDAAVLTDPVWTANVTQIASTTENADGKADNRYMWDIGSAGLTAATNYYVIAHIQEGSDNLFVQYTAALGPIERNTPIAEDRELVLTHDPYFRAETPLEGETIVVEGGDDIVFHWYGFDRDDATGGVVQAMIVPQGVAITSGAYADETYATTSAGGAGGATFYWLFPTATGQTPGAGTTGPTLTSGTYTFDVSTITTDQNGTAAVPSGFYDVYFYWTANRTAGIQAADTPVKGDGVLRFTGSTASTADFYLTPNKSTLSKGDTVTVSVKATSASTTNFVRLLAIAINIPSTYYTVIDQGTNAPFIGESAAFPGTAVLQNSMINSGGNWQLNYVEVDETPSVTLAAAATVAQFQIVVTTSGSGTEFIDNQVSFVNTDTRATGIVDANGNNETVTLADPAASLLLAPPGTISGQVELDVLNEVGASVDIHVLPLGSFTPISDANFLSANGGANSDGSISATLGTDGAYSVTSIPTGDYDVLVHKDYHLDRMETSVQVRAVTTTTVNFLGASLLLVGDIAGWDDDTDASTASMPDNQIGTDDISAVSDAFGSTPTSTNWNAAADFDADDYVYISDYNLVTLNYGASGVSGDGLVYKAFGRDANENVIAKLLAMSQAGDEVIYAIQLENLSSLHAYAVEMDINPDHWDVMSHEDGMADYFRAAKLHKVGAYGATFASGILGRNVIRAKEMTLMTVTLKAKVNTPDEILLTEVSLVDGNRGLTTAILGSSEAVPTEFSLSQNFPNPFNPATTINFSLPVEGQVKLAVYNLLGQEVRTLVSSAMDPGTYNAIWNSRDNVGRRVSSGMYFYRLVVDNKVVATKKMLFLK